jgi:hypothetical protein
MRKKTVIKPVFFTFEFFLLHPVPVVDMGTHLYAEK